MLRTSVDFVTDSACIELWAGSPPQASWQPIFCASYFNSSNEIYFKLMMRLCLRELGCKKPFLGLCCNSSCLTPDLYSSIGWGYKFTAFKIEVFRSLLNITGIRRLLDSTLISYESHLKNLYSSSVLRLKRFLNLSFLILRESWTS